MLLALAPIAYLVIDTVSTWKRQRHTKDRDPASAKDTPPPTLRVVVALALCDLIAIVCTKSIAPNIVYSPTSRFLVTITSWLVCASAGVAWGITITRSWVYWRKPNAIIFPNWIGGISVHAASVLSCAGLYFWQPSTAALWMIITKLLTCWLVGQCEGWLAKVFPQGKEANLRV